MHLAGPGCKQSQDFRNLTPAPPDILAGFFRGLKELHKGAKVGGLQRCDVILLPLPTDVDGRARACPHKRRGPLC
jgi:hypothetical protein